MYACLCETVCDVTTVPSHLKEIFGARLVKSQDLVEKTFNRISRANIVTVVALPTYPQLRQKNVSIAFLAPIS